MSFLQKVRNQMGLTLIELLAVVVILGVIAAIAVPAIGGTISSSKTKADIQTELLLKDTAYRYLVDTDPALASGTVTVAALVSAGYLKEALTEQSTDKAYVSIAYTYLAASGYTVGAVTTAP